MSKRAAKNFYFKCNIPVTLKKEIFDKLSKIFDAVLITCADENLEELSITLNKILKMSKPVHLETVTKIIKKSCGNFNFIFIKTRKIENVIKLTTQKDCDPLYKGFSMDQFRFVFNF